MRLKVFFKYGQLFCHRLLKIIIFPPKKQKSPTVNTISAKDEYLNIRGATLIREHRALLWDTSYPRRITHAVRRIILSIAFPLRPLRSICQTVLTSLTAPEALFVAFFRLYLRFNGLITL